MLYSVFLGGSATDTDFTYLRARANMHQDIACDAATFTLYTWNNIVDTVTVARLCYPHAFIIFTKSPDNRPALVPELHTASDCEDVRVVSGNAHSGFTAIVYKSKLLSFW